MCPRRLSSIVVRCCTCYPDVQRNFKERDRRNGASQTVCRNRVSWRERLLIHVCCGGGMKLLAFFSRFAMEQISFSSDFVGDSSCSLVICFLCLEKILEEALPELSPELFRRVIAE